MMAAIATLLLDACITARQLGPLCDWLEENSSALAGLMLYEPEAHRRAREIMGVNFLGFAGVQAHFGTLTQEQWLDLLLIPFSEKMLRECAETHILVADVGLSIVGVRAKNPGLFYEQGWYDGEEFATRTEKARWRLIRKHPVEGSFSKNWSEQQRLVNTETDEIPSARQIVYTTILHVLATKERLFEAAYVRTCDVDSDGNHVDVGGFGGGGLYVCGWLDGSRYAVLGLSAARKS